MSKGLKLYVLAGTTLLDVNKIDKIKNILPPKEEIVKHILDQHKVGNKDFQLFMVQIEKDQLIEIVKEVRRKSSVNISDSYIFLSLGDGNHPVISINEKGKQIGQK